MNKQIKLVANSNTEILITMPENKIQDFVIKLAKHYTDNYEPAEITICDIKEQANEKWTGNKTIFKRILRPKS